MTNDRDIPTFLKGLALGAAFTLPILLLCSGCVPNVTQVVTQQIHVITFPPPTPLPAGCSPISLDATPTGEPGKVALSLDPASTTGTLLDGGTSLGPVASGQIVTLATGTHKLQVTSGSCISNVVQVDVP